MLRRSAGRTVVIVMVVLSPLLTASAVSAQETVKALLADLSSPDVARRSQAEKELQRVSVTTGKAILEIAKKQVREAQAAQKKYYDTAAKRTPAETERLYGAARQSSITASQTILLLGKLHVEESIPFLLENIRFVYSGQEDKRWYWPVYRPCLGALLALGLPAADAILAAVEEAPIAEVSVKEPISGTAFWSQELLGRLLGPQGAAGYIQHRIVTLKAKQKAPDPFPPAPGKTPVPTPPPVPISVRIERLEAVRADVEANAKLWAEYHEVWLQIRHSWRSGSDYGTP